MKYFVAASLVILVINASVAQTKLGIKLTSSIITQRITHDDDSININNGSNAFVPTVTLIADFPMSRNYYFSTGVGYVSKRVNLNYSTLNDMPAQSNSYNVQYVQLPATLKLFTNEVALDKKLYFQFGPIFDIAVHTREKKEDVNIIEEFQPLDVTLLFAAGMEIQLAPNTALQIGFNYSRGLVNIVSSSYLSENNPIIKNDLYGIDLAIKF